ncbi:chondroitinase-B domain-containing protein [Aliiglaciecola sp. 3_MG-2023]|uniref:chondroitinase-B domain-containing protein n=1 Tax=Aliiglaciecola sp. 3_MG-2023 TaxID=3062644 RepID=UPI0026E352C9|nr:chondroitinase-B domain-containing protein [Aliiglaciecola sp. 3_MG-2023]MDO6693206.1 chondroitinase-B domain-containing protein [Aliiglaciecola sp. 3_MG-2023]
MFAKNFSFPRIVALTMVVSVVGCSASSQNAENSSKPTSQMASAKMLKTADGILINDQQQFSQAAASLQPGDTLILADKEWKDFEILLKGKGTAEKPITLKAQTKGKVILTGLSNLRLSGEYLVVEGLVFKDGYSPTGEVISFREDADTLANHSRVTEVVIDGFSNTDKFNSDKWVVLYGKNNRFDHSHLEGKNNAGVTMAVRLNSEASQQNNHRIDHNYFGPRPILGSNGGETLRIGTSKYSLSDSLTVVENNYFERCNGEVEIISNKSGKNKFLNNVFWESRGTLTLRHGNGNLVEGNVFFGNGKDHTGGIRVINADQTIRNNYMEGLTGIRFGGGFTILNGVPNSSINRYHQVKNAIIENNTIVNVDNINLAGGSDAERTATPIDSSFSNNLIINADGSNPFKIFDDVSGITFANNIASQSPQDEIASGFSIEKSDLKRGANGLLQSASAQQANVGAAASLEPISKDQTGVSWYPKADAPVEFDSGDVVNVSSAQELMKTIAGVDDGTVILLAPGNYDLNKQLQVKSVVTLKAATPRSVTLYPMRSLTFEIEDGGSLKLDGLNISGVKTPDNAGNVLIRNTKLPTLHNYKLTINNTHITDLNVNHSAHVFDSGYRSMAENLVITNSVFKNITGDVLRLDKEQDDLGIYNAEYITIKNSSFVNIEGAVAKVYRGGTDESTFGPHFRMTDSKVENVGAGKRNKTGSSIFLLGVQQTLLEGNEFIQNKVITIDHTVGEPRTQILNNKFVNTPLPVVTETFAGGPSTAVVVGNVSQ